MALRLVRQTSDTPNITNKDDVIMTRYAYGGYNGVVNGFGNECGYTAENGIFKILDGRIVVDGWEIDVDGAGWSFDFSNITGTQYHSVYAEINVSVETVDIKSSYYTGNYPTIEKGDDLTQIPNGTARLLLYNVQVENGAIKNVIKKFEIIPYLVQDIEKLKSGEIKSGNSKKVNDLEIKKDENGVLRVGDTIIPQKKLLWSGEQSTGQNTYTDIALSGSITNNRPLEIVYSLASYKNIRFRARVYEMANSQVHNAYSMKYGNTVNLTIHDIRTTRPNNSTVRVFPMNYLSIDQTSISNSGYANLQPLSCIKQEVFIYEIYEIIE